MKNKKTDKNLTLFTLTWPIFIEIFLHMIMGNADTLMLSQYDDNAVAAVGVANQLLFIMIVIFGFVATGTSILVAQNLGANNEKAAGEITIVSLGVNFLLGLLLSVCFIFFGDVFLRVMNLPNELFDQGIIYLQIVGGFTFIQGIFMTIGASLRSYSFTKDAMFVTVGMNVLNIIGNYLLIFGAFGFPELGVTGVAISTVVSRCIGLIAIVFLLVIRISEPLPFKLLIELKIEHVKKLLKIGLPSAGEQLSYHTSQMLIMFFITFLGTAAITTKIYTQNIMMFIFLFAIAVGQGTQIMVGHQVGAGKHEEAYERCLKSLKIAMVMSFTLALIFAVFSKPLLSIFTNNSTIIEMGIILMILTIVLEPGRAFNLVVINSLRAAGDVKFPMYIGILSMWFIGVPIAYFLAIPCDLGLIGIWISFIADEWLRGLLMLWRWRSKVWIQMSFINKKKTNIEITT
ncbi:MATE family efflux transporter [Bacillus taeanensis]|uniref:MATE family efflux transporter n=1 Tax=Bacillus taeanensis TaxID=273032 RepID=A0A366XTP1_9BACI|nr:MATE family efflux transporter [Bacillus taeanensis]RBW69512.1 MATE family efflux transporter [Bacillus taeanensis]